MRPLTRAVVTSIALIALLIPVAAKKDTTLLPNGATAAPTKIKVQGDLVNLSVDDSYDTPGNALPALNDAIAAYPAAQRFRLSFSLLVFNNVMQTTILYDRRKHSVILYSIGSGDVTGTFCDHVQFADVRESVFGQIAKAHRNDSYEDAWASMGDLPNYGCRKHNLGSRHKETPG